MGKCFITRRGGGQKKVTNYAVVNVAIQPNSGMTKDISGLNTGDFIIIMMDNENNLYALWEIHNGICTYVSSSNSWPFSSNVSFSVTATTVTITGTGGSSAAWAYIRFLKIT